MPIPPFVSVPQFDHITLLDLPDGWAPEDAAADMVADADWANLLQTSAIAHANAINDLDTRVVGLTGSLGVIGAAATPGSVFIAGADGYIKAVAPGSSNQVWQPNSNLPDGGEWVEKLPAATTRGALLTFTGTAWTVLEQHAAAVAGSSLIVDTDPSVPGVTWLAGTTYDKVAITKPVAPIYFKNDASIWYLTRTSTGVRTLSNVTYLWQSSGLYPPMPPNSYIPLGTVPARYIPSSLKTQTPGGVNAYNITTSAMVGLAVYCDTNGVFGLVTGSAAAGYWPNTSLSAAEVTVTRSFIWPA